MGDSLAVQQLTHQLDRMGNHVLAAPVPILQQRSFFQLGDAFYLATPVTELTLPPKSPSSLATVFYCPPTDQDPSWLHQQIQTWLEIDDVFHSKFLAGVVVVADDTCTRSGLLATSIDRLPDALKPTWWASVTPDNGGGQLRQGPHMISNGILHAVYRVYDDVHAAFVVATEPRLTTGPFSNLRVSGDFYSSLGIAVPSRIPRVQADSKRLRGVRFAIKDIFEVEGLRVTAGDRAFYSLSKPATATCPAIKRLIDAGAELLGTLKLGSLIAREEPTESVDYQASFNPRGDGYQSAWSSSGGSGAAIASYDWLDFTLGTDTTGSSRRPAMANGAFQIRLTHGVISLDNSVPSFPRFDSPAMYTRSILSLEKWVGAWLDQPTATYSDDPISLIYPVDFFPVANAEQMKLIDAFIVDMEATFGVKVEKVSIADTWQASPPTEANHAPIKEYLKDVAVNTFVYDVYHTMDKFREEYHEKFDREPYVNPVTRFRWDLAKSITSAEHEEGMRRLEVYKEWLLEHILQTSKKNALVVLPITSQEVDYKEDPPAPPTAPSAFDGIWLAPVMGAPEISVPIGEMKYHSRLSQRDEYLPIVVSVLGKPGSDMALINAMKTVLQKSGRPCEVKTGRRMFV
ncbi:amidase signature domain-containing protein [Diplogelasinospora grovesii]|uniref:Amidase signature domain-containing protein n=1 Tax=Diplogelasinospora grovesii TaxID=303347 RepID=A0AAN6MZ58_9PEZI|nr:amidase signature domain-containing protein [Diplogelasinospora grovesii]